MKRIISLIISLFILVAIAVATTISEARRPPDWQPELERYLIGQTTPSSGVLRLQSAVRASRPWQFSQDMIGRKTPNTGKYLPFPPAEVWCILLEQDRSLTGDATQLGAYTVVFAARHETVHFTYWVIYEGASFPSTPTFQENLSRLGCELKLGPSKLSEFMGLEKAKFTGPL